MKKESIRSVFHKTWKFINQHQFVAALSSGLILLLISVYINGGSPEYLKQAVNEKLIGTTKVLADIENYKIKAENGDLYSFDTLNITFRHQGIPAVLSKDFKLVSYEFTDKSNLYLEEEWLTEPELSLLEVFIENRVLDSINPVEKVQIQIKRKTIFKGYDLAWFEVTDKKVIGNLSFEFSYTSASTTYTDTLTTNIYLEK